VAESIRHVPINLESSACRYAAIISNSDSMNKGVFRFETTADPSLGEPGDYLLECGGVSTSAQPSVTGKDELPGKSNYFIGKDPQKWQKGIANSAKVKYQWI
jgi:hypothetical protein